jgi:hypothetical protein
VDALIAKAGFPHRGRFQAQGGKGRGLQASENWAQDDPLTAVDGHFLLTTLHDKLDPADGFVREAAFAEAHQYIDAAAAANGIGPTKKTFPKRGVRSTDPRVDIEVNSGLAFVP